LGETHILVCGLSSPRLDHAMRTLAWTHSAQSAVLRLGTEWANSISLRFGLASGEIDVLILNAAHTAFDVRGRTLAIARRISADAKPGSVQVDSSTFALLTDVKGFEAAPPIGEPVLGTLRSWSRPAAPTVPGKADLQTSAAE
jgi:class 3 adenylate cyclase